MSKTFSERVYDVIEKIPYGQVASYGQISFLAGSLNSARAVGNTLRRIPGGRQLPCHRVLRKSGALPPGDIFGGEGIQRQLLKNEGITFLPNGRVNMDLHRWNPSGL